MSDYIFSRVERLVQKHKTRDPFALMDAMRVRVVFSDVYPQDGLKGYCALLNRTQYVVINSQLPECEQRVVGGHELGHVILHADYLRMGAMRDMDIYQATGKTEREANLYAADTLISDQDALEAIQDSDSDFFNAARSLYIPAPFFAFKLYSMVERGYAMRVPVELSNTFLRGRK